MRPGTCVFEVNCRKMGDPASSPACDRNPSPPPELRQNKELDLADKVGQSAFSKHWIFSTLMKLIQEVDKESEKPEAEHSELGIDVNEDLQNELCELWDMSMNPDVAEFLYEFKAMDILGGVIRTSKAPRVVEICVGILGNMVCNKKVCVAISNNPVLVDLLLMLLESRDPQTLVETARLCYVCLCNESVSQIWLKAVKECPNSQDNLKFLFQSSTNVDLLTKLAEFLDKLLELDDDLCSEWANQEMVQSLLEGVQQVGYSQSEALEVYLHVFELLSTTEKGVEALVSEYEKVLVPLKKYLAEVCEYEIVGLDGRERCLCSALAVLNVVFSSSPDVSTSIIEDEQNMRYLLKILEPLFSRIQQLKANNLHPSSIYSDSSADRDESPQKLSEEGGGDIVNFNGGDKTIKSVDTLSKSETDKTVYQPADNTPDDKKLKQAGAVKEDISKYLFLLYEIVQGFLCDITSYLHSTVPEQVKKKEITVPPVLQYLDTMCTRARVSCLINTLEEFPQAGDGTDPVVKLSDLAQRYQLRRLCNIIDNVPSRKASVCLSEPGS